MALLLPTSNDGLGDSADAFRGDSETLRSSHSPGSGRSQGRRGDRRLAGWAQNECNRRRGRAFRALRDRTGRRRNARHASEAGLPYPAERGALLLPGKGAVKRNRWWSSLRDCAICSAHRYDLATLSKTFPPRTTCWMAAWMSSSSNTAATGTNRAPLATRGTASRMTGRTFVA
jgi:hypothetical protein